MISKNKYTAVIPGKIKKSPEDFLPDLKLGNPESTGFRVKMGKSSGDFPIFPGMTSYGIFIFGNRLSTQAYIFDQQTCGVSETPQVFEVAEK